MVDVKKRILIAEDEDSIATSLEFLMRNGGYETRVSRDGIDALACAATFLPHLVLLDVMLPGKSGFEVCQSIRADPLLRATWVVMLTAKGGKNATARGLDCGADEYVVKPFSTRELLARVHELLAREKRQ
jgi:DNA-binding response OmpR family regulator